MKEQLERSKSEKRLLQTQLEEAQTFSKKQASIHSHSQSLNKLQIDANLIRAANERDISTIRDQLLSSENDKRNAEERLSREMEAIQGTLNLMQHQGRSEDVWKGRCLTMKAEVEALRGERDGLVQPLQAQRLNHQPVPLTNQRSRPALALNSANLSNNFSGPNGRMF